MQKIRTLTALVVLGLAASGSAFAQPADYNAPWRGSFWGYLGASAGESKFRTECANTNVFSCDQRDTGWKVHAGGKFNDVFGLEFAYVDFGRINTNGGDTEAFAVPLSLTVGTPLGERFGIFGKVGGLYGRTDVTADPSTLFDTGHKNGWGWTYGAGATFAMAQNLQIRVDWDRYKLDFAGGAKDVDMMSAGLQFRF